MTECSVTHDRVGRTKARRARHDQARRARQACVHDWDVRTIRTKRVTTAP